MVGACGGVEEEEPPERKDSRARAAEVQVEATPLENLALEPLLPPRPFQPSDSMLADLRYRDPAADGWESEVLAPVLERALERLLAARLAGSEPPGELLGRPLDELSGLDVAYPGRGAEPPGEVPTVEVEVVRCEPTAGGGWRSDGRVTIVRRPSAGSPTADAGLIEPGSEWDTHLGAFQCTLALSCEWEVSAGGPRLVAIEPRVLTDAAPVAVARAPLFVDRTRRAFGDDPAFDEEILRGADAYYFHSDRLTGYDLVCNHGMAVGDVDGDGLEDVYVCMPAGIPNRLFLRREDGGTREAALPWKVAFLDATRSALIVDLDGDGRRDLACAVGANVVLCWNDGTSFARASVLRPEGPEDVFSLAACDADRDGDLDLYACRYGAQGVMKGNPTPYHDARNGAPNVFWRNEGGRRFVDATAQVGFDQGNTRFSFAALWEDYDDDGDPDLYVANDFGRNHYWRNDGGRFEDVADAIGAEDMAAGMGVSAGDVDGDGDLDLYVSNIYAAEGLRVTARAEAFLRGRAPDLLPIYQRHARGNTLLLNRGDGTFEDASVARNANRGGWAWGAQLFDVENDGDLDVYSPNGFISGAVPAQADEYFWRYVVARSPAGPDPTQEYRDAWRAMQYLGFELREGWNGDEPNVLLLNDGSGSFVDASGLSGADVVEDSRAVVALDWDRDGFLDLLLKNRNGPRLRLLRNRGTRTARDAWLVIELQGASGNRDGIGAQVRVVTERSTLRRSIAAGDGFLTQSSRRLHFGLGAAREIDAVEVRWPDGTRQRLETGFDPGRAYRIVRGEPQPRTLEWAPMVAFAEEVSEPVAALPGYSARTVLCDKLPMAPAPLPASDDPERRIEDLAGRPLLVTFWRHGDPASEGQLRRFARGRATIEASGLQLAPLALGGGFELTRARELTRSLGLDEPGGFVDARTLQAFEVLLLEVYHRAETNPVPTSLLLDRAGQLCVIYQGPVRLERLLADVRDLRRLDPTQGTCARLQRGRWIQPRPRRDVATLAEVFEMQAYPELAELYRGLAERTR